MAATMIPATATRQTSITTAIVDTELDSAGSEISGVWVVAGAVVVVPGVVVVAGAVVTVVTVVVVVAGTVVVVVTGAVVVLVVVMVVVVVVVVVTGAVVVVVTGVVVVSGVVVVGGTSSEGICTFFRMSSWVLSTEPNAHSTFLSALEDVAVKSACHRTCA